MYNYVRSKFLEDDPSSQIFFIHLRGVGELFKISLDAVFDYFKSVGKSIRLELKYSIFSEDGPSPQILHVLVNSSIS